MRWALCGALSLGLSAHAAEPAEPKARPVPSLAKEPKLDGALKDLNGALAFRAGDEKTSASFQAKVATRGEALWLGVEVSDDVLLPGDLLSVSLHFPGAGTTARGYTYRFAFDGKRAADPETGAPEFADRLVQAAVSRQEKAMALEILVPLRAFPRFPAKEPLNLELCLTYEDRDEVGEKAKPVTNCEAGSMAGGPLRLTDELRRGLKLKPPERVVALEARPTGWLGYGTLHYPKWVLAREELSPQSLRALVSDAAVDPKEVRIPLPNTMVLPGGQLILGVLSGKDPYEVDGECDSDHELRLALYLVTGKTGERVLEWPASTCALGRAVSISLNDEGELTIGYSNGSTTNFTWSTDHFERTEFGMR